MDRLVVQKKNEVFLTIQAEPHVHLELSDYFTFEVPEAKFLKKNPRYRNWDGTIRLYSPASGQLYVGLWNQLKEWCDQRRNSIEIVDNNWYGRPDDTNDFISPQGCLLYTSPSPRD